MINNIFGYNNITELLSLSLERQNLLDIVAFELNNNWDFYITNNMQILIDLVVLKYKIKDQLIRSFNIVVSEFLHIDMLHGGISNFDLVHFIEYKLKNLNFLKNNTYAYLFNELDTSDTFQNREDFLHLLELHDEVIDFRFELLSMGFRSYVESRGQLL
jgi:hypothetical protein